MYLPMKTTGEDLDRITSIMVTTSQMTLLCISQLKPRPPDPRDLAGI